MGFSLFNLTRNRRQKPPTLRTCSIQAQGLRRSARCRLTATLCRSEEDRDKISTAMIGALNAVFSDSRAHAAFTRGKQHQPW